MPRPEWQVYELRVPSVSRAVHILRTRYRGRTAEGVSLLGCSIRTLSTGGLIFSPLLVSLLILEVKANELLIVSRVNPFVREGGV